MMKRKLAMILTATMVLSLVQPALAAEVPGTAEIEIAVMEEAESEDAGTGETVSEEEVQGSEVQEPTPADDADSGNESDSSEENLQDDEDETEADGSSDASDESSEGATDASDESSEGTAGENSADTVSDAETDAEQQEADPSDDSETFTEDSSDGATELGEEADTAEQAAVDEEEDSAEEAESADQSAPEEEAVEILENAEETVVKEAAEGTVTIGSEKYTFENISGGVRITGYSGKPSGGKLTIPGKLNGYNVLSIGNSVFKGNTNITSVSFPGTLTEIGSNAFVNCTSLKTVALPSSLRSLGDYAFSNTAITSIKIPKNLTDIDYFSPFKNCSKLTSVTFESGMKTIPYHILYGVNTVRTVTIPDSVTKIDSYAFAGTSISEFKGHNNITTIEEGAFANCASLKTVVLPSALRALGDYAFSNTAITSIKIPKNLTDIDYFSPFKNCSKLTSVAFESGMKTIPYHILYEVNTVRTVTIPDSVTKIDSYAFAGTSISEFKGHNNITTIEEGAFANCASLKTVVLPSALRSLGDYAFSNTAITSIKIPKNLTDIDYFGAFRNCRDLKNVTFESGMRTIPYHILYEVSAVETVTIPKSVTLIDSYAFYNCTNLSKVKYLGTASEWDKLEIKSGNDALDNAKLICMLANKITAKDITRSYSTKTQTFKLGAKATGGKLTYKSNKAEVKVSSDGTVTISPKFSGTAKITITAKGGNYMTVMKAVKITVPSRTTLSGVDNTAAGTMLIKWKKNAYVTGYIIQYSQKSDFSDAKTLSVSKNSTVSRSVKGLTKGKKYYVRIRSFRTVGGKKYYSAWSGSKTVTIKK